MEGPVRLHASDARTALPDLISAARQWCEAYHRPDLSARLAATRRRTQQRTTTVCVAGDYKQGKSSLVNALIERHVCPVDSTDATIVFTRLSAGQDDVLRVHREGDSGIVEDVMQVADLGTYASEAANPNNRKRVQLLDAAITAPLLDSGVVVIDSPGIGALRAGSAAAILGTLDHVDAMLFVSDALAELSEPETDFLTRAAQSGVDIMVVLTKVDLSPEWRRIVDTNRGHLSRAGVEAPVIPVSCELWAESARRQDPHMDQESGLPALRETLRRAVLDPAGDAMVLRSLAHVEGCLATLEESLRAQRDALRAASASEEVIVRFEEATRRHTTLRSAGARWMTVLADGVTDLTQHLDSEVRTLAQTVGAWATDELGSIDPGEAWEPFVAELQTRLTEGSIALAHEARTGAIDLASSVRALIDSEALQALPADPSFDLDDVWAGTLWAPSSVPGVAASALGAIRGGAGGIYLLGVVGGLAGLTVAAPISIGVGTAFGAKQVVDERRRSRAARQREARAQARTLIAHAESRIAVGLRDFVKQTHRSLRDHFAALIEEQRDAAQVTMKALEADLKRDQAQRADRARHLDTELTRLQELRRTIAQLSGRDDPSADGVGHR